MDGIILSFASCVSVYIVLVWKLKKGIIVSMDEQYKEIIDAAVSLFDQKGLAFTVDDICNAIRKFTNSKMSIMMQKEMSRLFD